MIVRPYKPADYESLKELYLNKSTYGGIFDDARDAPEKLAKMIEQDPFSIIMAEADEEITGTVSLIENPRVAWLYRFAVSAGVNQSEVTQALYKYACDVLKSRGHTQILVYSDPHSNELTQRYLDLGMNEGGTYKCFWVEPK